MFPAEIYERILKYATGQTLLRAKCVCKQWKQIVEYLENKYDLWEQCCKRELPDIALHDMQDKCGYVDNLKHKWKVLFKNYQSWQNIRTKGYHVLPKQSIDYFENNITCAKLSGSRIVYGNTAGIICVLNEEYEVEDVIITDIRGTLRDIIFLNEVEAKDSTAYNHTHVIVFYEKSLLVLKLEPKIEQVVIIHNVVHFSVYNNIVAYSDLNGVVRVHNIDVDSLVPTFFQQIAFCRVYSPTAVRSLCIYENIVVLITDREVLTFDYTLNSASIAKVAHPLPFPYGLMEKYWTFHNNIVFSTSNCDLYLSTINSNGKNNVTRKLNCMQGLESPVCDIYLYGNVLILGTISGKVFIYIIDDWAEFELQNYDLKIHIYGEPICSIDVQELEYEHRLLLTMNDYIAQLFIY